MCVVRNAAIDEGGGGGYVIVVREERGRVRARRYVVAGDTLVEGGSAPMTYRTVRKCIGVCVRTATYVISLVEVRVAWRWSS